MKITSGIVNPVQLSTTAGASGGKLILPVKRGDSFYAHYKYVKGIPSTNQQRSVPLKKLEIINTMIHSLQRLRELGASRLDSDIMNRILTPPEKTVEGLGAEIYNRVNSSPPAFANELSSVAATGMAFEFSA